MPGLRRPYCALARVSFLIFVANHAECTTDYGVTHPPTCYLTISDKHPSCDCTLGLSPRAPPPYPIHPNCLPCLLFHLFPPLPPFPHLSPVTLPRCRSPDSYRLPSCSASTDVIASGSLYSLLLAASDTMTSLILTALLTFSHLGLPQCFSERWNFKHKGHR